MFDKLKNLNGIREQGKKLQAMLEEEKITVEESGIKLTMSGKFDIIEISIDEELLAPENKEKLENLIKNAHKNALSKIQRQVAWKMQQMGGFPGLV